MTDVAALGASVTLTGAVKADKELAAFGATATKTEAAVNRFTRSAAGVDAMFKTNGRSAKEAEADLQAYADEMDNLRAKYNPLFAASKKYETALNEINRAEQIGAINAREAAAAREVLSATTLRLASVTDTAGASIARMGRNAQGGAGGLQNVGYQIQDFAVQVGAGTSAAQALGQQLPQLLSGFGLFGILAGTAAAVLLPLAGYFFSASEKAKSLEDAMGSLTDSIDSYQQFIIRAGQSTVQLREEFGKFSNDIVGFSQFMAGVNLGQTFDNLKLAMDPLKGSLSEFQSQLVLVAESQAAFNLMSKDGFASAEMIFQQGEALKLFKDQLSETASEMGLTVIQASNLAAAMDDVGRAKSMEEIAASAGRALAILRDIDRTGVGLPPSLRAAANALDEMQTKAAKAAAETARIAANAPGGGWLNPAIGGTNALIERLNIVVARVQKLANFSVTATATTKGQGVITAPGTIDLNQPTGGTGSINLGMKKGGGGGGGGGKEDPYQNNLDALIKSLMTERETVEKWYADSEVLLNDKRAREQMGEAAHKEAMLDLERQYQEKIKGIKDEGAQGWLTDTSKLFGDLNTLAGGGYESLLKAQKGFAAAEALINTYRAAAQVLADPKMSFWMKFAAVAKVVASGMGLVNAIKGGGKSSGSSGGGASTSGSTATQATPERVVRVSFQGDPFLTAMASSMMDQIYAASKGGRVIIAQ